MAAASVRQSGSLDGIAGRETGSDTDVQAVIIILSPGILVFSAPRFLPNHIRLR
jgi:hypothetical protein